MAVNKYENRRIWMNTGAAAKLKNLATEEATVKRTRKIYRQAQKDIQTQVDRIYEEFGALSEANRWNFTGLNKTAKRKDINELRKAINKAGLTDYVPEALSNRMNVLQVRPFL